MHFDTRPHSERFSLHLCNTDGYVIVLLIFYVYFRSELIHCILQSCHTLIQGKFRFFFNKETPFILSTQPAKECSTNPHQTELLINVRNLATNVFLNHSLLKNRPSKLTPYAGKPRRHPVLL